MNNANLGSGVPVMVWIHGGGLTGFGSADFDPSPLVLQGNVIVVTIDYRLGYWDSSRIRRSIRKAILRGITD